jgi:hypothetical protein
MVSALGCELTDSSEFHSKTKYLIGTANEAVEKPTFEPLVRPVCCVFRLTVTGHFNLS